MKKFILKTLAFIFFIVIIFCLFATFNFEMFQFEQKSLSIKNKHILLLGDSNMEYAINDSIFASAINKAASADSYFYSYLKLKLYTSLYGKIDTVFLSFAPHNIFDNGWLLDDDNIYSRFRFYYFLMDWTDFKFLLLRNPRGVISSIPSVLRQTLKNIVKKAKGVSLNPSYGGFDSLDRNILEEVKLKLRKGQPLPFFKIPNNFKISLAEIAYLNKTIAYCDKNNIKLYLINLPKRVELLNYSKYGVDNFYAEYDEKYRNLDFLDFSRFPLPEDNYGDFVHLNSKGSTNFSSFLQKDEIGSLLTEFGRNKVRMHDNFYK